jgi:hypothetical protein
MPATRSSKKKSARRKRRAPAVDDSDVDSLQAVRRLPRMDDLVICDEDGNGKTTIEENDWLVNVIHLSFPESDV